MGHLGSRTSALLDGQLSPAEAERAWEHVHACHLCRDHVEREGWVKTRLAGMSFQAQTPAPSAWLKGSLLAASQCGPPGDVFLQRSLDHSRRRTAGLAAIGGGAIGAAVVGVLAFGVAPASAPTIDRPAPASITQSEQPRPPALVRQSGFVQNARR